jgi:hypothetical protein
MDLQQRKIHFVQEFLRLNNEAIINKLEDILKLEKIKNYSAAAVPYTMDEFIQMIDKAEDDSKNNRVKSVHELKEDSKSWD